MVVVVRIAAAAVAAEKAHVVNQRLLARLPQNCYGTRVNAARKYSDSADDGLSPWRSVKITAFGAPTPWYSGVSSSKSICVSVGWSAMSTVSGLSVRRVSHHVMTAGKIEDAMRMDGLLQRGSVVRCPIALHSQRVHVHPFAAWR